MRESRRGSMRSEMATDSEVSELPATAASMRRRSGLFSAQKSASASSLSKIGTSSHLAIARIASATKSHHTSHIRITHHVSLRQHLVHFALVEEPFFRLERAGVEHPSLLSRSEEHTSELQS